MSANSTYTTGTFGTTTSAPKANRRFSHLSAVPSKHFVEQVIEKNLDSKGVTTALHSPAQVYPSASHPGQWRMCGGGICLVVLPDEEAGTLTLITAYLDGVVTAPRADQLHTTAGAEFARRHAAGAGRTSNPQHVR